MKKIVKTEVLRKEVGSFFIPYLEFKKGFPYQAFIKEKFYGSKTEKGACYDIKQAKEVIKKIVEEGFTEILEHHESFILTMPEPSIIDKIKKGINGGHLSEDERMSLYHTMKIEELRLFYKKIMTDDIDILYLNNEYQVKYTNIEKDQETFLVDFRVKCKPKFEYCRRTELFVEQQDNEIIIINNPITFEIENIKMTELDVIDNEKMKVNNEDLYLFFKAEDAYNFSIDLINGENSEAIPYKEKLEMAKRIENIFPCS